MLPEVIEESPIPYTHSVQNDLTVQPEITVATRKLCGGLAVGSQQ